FTQKPARNLALNRPPIHCPARCGSPRRRITVRRARKESARAYPSPGGGGSSSRVARRWGGVKSRSWNSQESPPPGSLRSPPSPCGGGKGAPAHETHAPAADRLQIVRGAD